MKKDRRMGPRAKKLTSGNSQREVVKTVDRSLSTIPTGTQARVPLRCRIRGMNYGYTRFRTCQISTETDSQATVAPMSTIHVL